MHLIILIIMHSKLWNDTSHLEDQTVTRANEKRKQSGITTFEEQT